MTILYPGLNLDAFTVKVPADESGSIQNSVTREYPTEFPKPGWSQRNPQDWMAAVTDGINALFTEADRNQMAGIGIGGQYELSEYTANIAFAGFTASKLL